MKIPRPISTQNNNFSSQILTRNKLYNMSNNQLETSAFGDKLISCVDPLINKEYGCMAKDNKNKASCMYNLIPNVLSCLYLGNSKSQYCINVESEYDIPCNKDCDKSFSESRKIYGCANSYGKVQDCDVTKLDFCDCSVSGKEWNGILDECKCPSGEIDYDKCCSTLICDNNKKESFSCDTESCECNSGLERIGNNPDNDCIKMCSTGAPQNTAINDPNSIYNGCGSPNGNNDDLCCYNSEDPHAIQNFASGKSGMCVPDNGWADPNASNWKNPSIIGTSKQTCLQNNGIWEITDSASCPRLGACNYPICHPSNNLIAGPTPPEGWDVSVNGVWEGPTWAFQCDDNKCSIPSCEDSCKNWCGVGENYKKSECLNFSEASVNSPCLCSCNNMI